MKKIITVILIFSLLLCFASCDKENSTEASAGKPSSSESGSESASEAAPLEIKIGGTDLKDMSVVCKRPALSDIANDFASRLSALCGSTINVSTKTQDKSITLTLSNTEGNSADKYSISVSSEGMTISANSKEALSFAVQDFAEYLKTNTTLEAGEKQMSITMKNYKSEDTALFKYCGTWNKEGDAMVSYWNAAYVEIDFEGNAINANFTKPSSFRIKMDNADKYSELYSNISGEVTFFAEGDGKHTLRIYSNDRNSHIYFGGVSVPEATLLSRTPDKQHYIQFVGDSISDATNSFSHRVGDVLGWDFSVTALSGISLRTNYGCWKHNNGFNASDGTVAEGSMADLIYKNSNGAYNNIGMEDAFFKLGIPQETMKGEERELYAQKYMTSDELDYNFDAGYTPDIVFIFLGTNDGLEYSGANPDGFTAKYLEFVERILETYGDDTQICILNSINSNNYGNVDENFIRITSIRETADHITETYPDNVTFIDYDIIKTWGITFADFVHPDANGYNAMTKGISEILKDCYGS